MENIHSKLHIALIMDGNGRWASKNELSRSKGHHAGALNMLKLLENLPNSVSTITAYAFSTENWSRSIKEIYWLFRISQEFFDQHTQTLINLGFKVHFIGDLTLIPGFIRNVMHKVEIVTQHGQRGVLNLAVSYGSKQEIVQAASALYTKGEILNLQTFNKQLSVGGAKDPDILIRTGGEKRLSNYLLWQLAYTELFFIDTLWPDFTHHHLSDIIAEYIGRNRKFGFV